MPLFRFSKTVQIYFWNDINTCFFFIIINRPCLCKDQPDKPNFSQITSILLESQTIINHLFYTKKEIVPYRASTLNKKNLLNALNWQKPCFCANMYALPAYHNNFLHNWFKKRRRTYNLSKHFDMFLQWDSNQFITFAMGVIANARQMQMSKRVNAPSFFDKVESWLLERHAECAVKYEDEEKSQHMERNDLSDGRFHSPLDNKNLCKENDQWF